MAEGNYPVRRPGPNGDSRFTIGLVSKVADVLRDAGYPAPEGREWVDLQQALFVFIYGETDGA